MTNLDSILKRRDMTLPTKVCLVKAMVFPVVMYGWASWTIEKAEHRKIDAFELWCWRRLLRVLWTARRSNQFILKEISSEYSLEGLMLKLKLQYLGHLMWRTDSLEKILMLRKTEGRRRRGRQRMRWLDGITDSMDMSLRSSKSWWWTGRPGMLQSMGSWRVKTRLNWNLSQSALKGNICQRNLSYSSHNPPAPALVSSPRPRQQDLRASQGNPTSEPIPTSVSFLLVQILYKTNSCLKFLH